MNIYWSISTIEDVKFVKRFTSSVDFNVKLIHTNIITYIYSSVFLRFKNYIPLYHEKMRKEVDVSESFNVLSGRLNEREALAAYSATYSLLERLNIKQDDVFMIPSGRQVHQWAIRDFSVFNGNKKLFINYGNFPGYTIFDSKGTDRNSSIYNNLKVLDEIKPSNYTELEIESIFSKFLDLKNKQKVIPQASGGYINKKAKEVVFFVEFILQRVFSIYSDRRRITKPKIEPEKEKKPLALKLENLKLKSDDCIFFPLQVSTDQQVLLNYSGGSIEAAIEEVILMAKERSKIILLKEHPGEHNKRTIKDAVTRMCNSSGVRYYWINDHVSTVINEINEVVTVNSTVGLEGLMNNNKVTFLGDSLYKSLGNQHIAKYLNDYLIEVDYQSQKSICSEKVTDILSRAR